MFGIKKKIEQARLHGMADGIQKERDRNRQERDRLHDIELQQYLGKKVIAISNEWENPIVGVVTGFEPITKAQRLVPIIHDYIRNEDVLCLSKIKFYTEQKLNAILTLDPFSVIALVYNCYDTDENFEKVKRGDRWPKENITEILRINGFFDLPDTKGVDG